MRRDLVIGVHIDGVAITVALVDATGAIVPDKEGEPAQTVQTPARRGGEAILGHTLQLIAQVREQAPHGLAVLGIGVGSEGIIDRDGVVRSAPAHFTDYAGTRLAERIAQECRLPVRVVSDIHTYALGEAWCGAAAGAQTAIFVGVGSGVYGSVLIHGRPWNGTHCVAGQVGHITSPRAAGLRCSCGKEAHVEAIASGPGIRAEYERRGGGNLPTGQAVIFAAGRGEDLALKTVATCAAAVGDAVGSLTNALDCEVVVVGGPVVEAGDCWWEPMEDSLRATLVPELVDLPVHRASLGHEAALIGAARLAWDAVDKAVCDAAYAEDRRAPETGGWL